MATIRESVQNAQNWILHGLSNFTDDDVAERSLRNAHGWLNHALKLLADWEAAQIVRPPVAPTPLPVEPVKPVVVVQPEPAVIQPSCDNQAAKYGAVVRSIQLTPGQAYWKVVKIRRLSGSENRSSHNVFIKVLGPNGQRDRNPQLRTAWFWKAGEILWAGLDKPDTSMERGHGDVPVEKGMTVTLWIDGDGCSSEIVSGLHTNHDDEPEPSGELWNTRGHFSFEVVYQKAVSL